MFAGPNGSGKSTIKDELADILQIKTYVNADELEAQAKATGFIDLAAFGIDPTADQIAELHAKHPLLIKKERTQEAALLRVEGSKIDYRSVKVDSYFAAVIADFIRQQLLDRGESFTFETVMSHQSKIDILRRAQELGYRTYLYFVSTENPEINVDRVRIRVEGGGHKVEPDTVRARYAKSLELLPEAVACSNRAFIFDNSGASSVELAEITDGTGLKYLTDDIPVWFFEAYVDKVDGGHRE
ncbi:MAG: zeta toxin family protein [Pseudomonas sp.]|nr:zeta toxin family protein [Pseudomonas sp.]